MRHLYAILEKYNKPMIKRSLFGIGIFSFLLMSFNVLGFLIPNEFTSFDMLDVKLFYSKEVLDFYMNMYESSAWVGSYLILHAEDYIFIMTFYPWLALTMFGLIPNEKKKMFFLLIPLLAMACDFFENVVIDISLLSHSFSALGYVAGFLTLFKFVFLLIAIILIGINIYRKHRQSRNGYSEI